MVRAGDHWCALPLSRVRRVMPGVKLHPLPGSAPQVAGLAEIDGEPLVILSLERLIEAPAGPLAEFPVTLVVAAGIAREVVGLMADEAGEIVRLEPAAIVGPPRGLVRGEVRAGDRVARVLDLAALGEEE